MNQESGAWAVEPAGMEKNHKFADTQLWKGIGVTGLPCVSGSYNMKEAAVSTPQSFERTKVQAARRTSTIQGEVINGNSSTTALVFLKEIKMYRWLFLPRSKDELLECLAAFQAEEWHMMRRSYRFGCTVKTDIYQRSMRYLRTINTL